MNVTYVEYHLSGQPCCWGVASHQQTNDEERGKGSVIKLFHTFLLQRNENNTNTTKTSPMYDRSIILSSIGLQYDDDNNDA
mmetsp:Transcript_24673/g.40503  ORF Transcript_24673/g.40503 Transcript_24673/m.40503 type:complete len:81 (-) Transcript_24673:17-259(-)